LHAVWLLVTIVVEKSAALSPGSRRVISYQTAWHHISEDSEHHSHWHENLQFEYCTVFKDFNEHLCVVPSAYTAWNGAEVKMRSTMFLKVNL